MSLLAALLAATMAPLPVEGELPSFGGASGWLNLPENRARLERAVALLKEELPDDTRDAHVDEMRRLHHEPLASTRFDALLQIVAWHRSQLCFCGAHLRVGSVWE